MSMEPILSGIISDVTQVLEQLDAREYDCLVEHLTAAQRVFVAGAGRSLLMLKAVAMRLMHIGKTVYVVGETTTPAAQAGDILLLGTGSGETATLKAIASKAKAAQMTIIVLTTDPASTLAGVADMLLVIPASVNHLSPNGASWQPGGNSFEQSLLLVGDGLVMDVAKRMGVEMAGKLTRHANLE